MGVNIQGIRNTTLQSLVKEIDATSLARMLGYSKQTLSRHARAASAPMSSYVVGKNPRFAEERTVATNRREKSSDKARAHVYAPISFHLQGDSMRHSRIWQNTIYLLFLGPLMTSCASGPVGKAGTDVAAPSQSVSTPPLTTCASFLPSAPCSQYVSISGTSNGVTLPWVATGGLTVELHSVNGGLQFAAKTPCNPISGPAAITGNTLTVDELAVGAMGCAGDPSAQEQWVVQFLKRPIEMAFGQDTLTWTTGADTLSFKSK